MHILTAFFIFLELVFVISGQSCIRNEVLENWRPQDTAAINLLEINNTVQQGFQSIGEELKEIRQLFSTILRLHPGTSPSHPALSCKEIYDRNSCSPSGYYWLQSTSEHIIRAYCDMERTCGGIHGGWMKVTSIDMLNSTHSCPSGLRTLTSPKRLCAMNINAWTWLLFLTS